MIKAVLFDMYETLITHYRSELYFSIQMAMDAGLSIAQFQGLWRESEEDRTLGKITFKEVMEMILEKHHQNDPKILATIISKRNQTKEACFDHLHEEIIPLLEALKQKGIKIGLISNCFDEEAKVIRNSILFPYFDKVCLSCEEHVAKPDIQIYHRIIEALGVRCDECIYIGDGGSHELETAQSLGMKTYQATWYFCEANKRVCQRKQLFKEVSSPLEVLNVIKG